MPTGRHIRCCNSQFLPANKSKCYRKTSTIKRWCPFSWVTVSIGKSLKEEPSYASQWKSQRWASMPTVLICQHSPECMAVGPDPSTLTCCSSVRVVVHGRICACTPAKQMVWTVSFDQHCDWCWERGPDWPTLFAGAHTGLIQLGSCSGQDFLLQASLFWTQGTPPGGAASTPFILH